MVHSSRRGGLPPSQPSKRPRRFSRIRQPAADTRMSPASRTMTDLLDAFARLEGMRLLRITEKALVTTASTANDTGVPLDAAFMAVDRWHVALFQHDISAIDTLEP